MLLVWCQLGSCKPSVQHQVKNTVATATAAVIWPACVRLRFGLYNPASCAARAPGHGGKSSWGNKRVRHGLHRACGLAGPCTHAFCPRHWGSSALCSLHAGCTIGLVGPWFSSSSFSVGLIVWSMAGRVMLTGLLLFLEKHNAGMPSHVEVLCVKYNQSGFLGCEACMWQLWGRPQCLIGLLWLMCRVTPCLPASACGLFARSQDFDFWP